MDSNTHSTQPPGQDPDWLAALAVVTDKLATQDLDRLPDAVVAERVLRLRQLVDRLVLQPEFVIFTVRWLAGGSGRHERGLAVGVSTTTSATSGRCQRPVRRRGRRTGAGSRCRSTG